MADRAVPSSVADAPNALGTLGRRARGVTGIGVRPGRAWSVARFSLDAAMLVTAGVATTLGSSAVDVPAPPVFWLAVFVGFVLAFCGARGMYGSRLRYELLEDLRVVLIATSLAAMAVLSLRELISAPPDLSAQVIRTWAFATAYVAAGRVALHWSRAQAYRQGESLRPTLIIGAGKVGRLAAKRLLAHPELGLKPVGFLDKDPMAAEDDSLPLPVLGASWDLDRVAAQYDVEQVIVTFSRAPHEVMLRLIRRCEELGMNVAFVPRLFETVTHRLDGRAPRRPAADLGRARNPKGIQFAIKYAVDRLVAALVLLLALPLMVRGRARDPAHRSAGRSSSASVASAATAGRSRCSSSGRCARVGAEPASPALDLPPDTAPGRRRGRRPAHAARHVPAPHLARRAAAADQRPQGRDEPRSAPARAPRVRRASSSRASTATTTGTASSPGSPAGRRCTASAARRPSPTGSSGTTTTSRTGRSGSTSRFCS